MTRLLTLAAVAAIPAAAQAQCVTTPVSAAPITVEMSEGDVSTFSAMGGGMVREELVFPGDDLVTVIETIGGLYVTEIYDTLGGSEVPDSRSVYRFPEAPPPVAPDTTFATVIAVDPGTDFAASQTQSYGFGALTTVTYGGCDYAVIPVTIVQRAEDGYVFTETLEYLPDLGIGIFTAYQDADGREVYEVVRLRPGG